MPHCIKCIPFVQVDIERSYALVLHKLVKRINGKLTHLLRQALDEQLTQDSNCQLASPGAAYSCTPLQPVARLQPLTNMYQFQLAQMASHLDVRVYRRVARELWNAAAGVGRLLMCTACSSLAHSYGQARALTNISLLQLTLSVTDQGLWECKVASQSCIVQWPDVVAGMLCSCACVSHHACLALAQAGCGLCCPPWQPRYNQFQMAS